MLNGLVLRLDHFEVILVVLRLLAESLGKILSFLLVRVNCMLFVDMCIVLYLHHLIFKCPPLNQEQFSFILDVFLGLLNLVLVLEVVLRYLIAFSFSFCEPLLEPLDAVQEIIFFEVPLLNSDDLVLAISLDCFFKQFFLLKFVKF
jgi:hypothetical protein